MNRLLGPLADLLDDPAVTDVLVNAPDEVWIDRGGQLERTTVRFADESAVRALAVRLAAAAGRRLDNGAPFADVRLPDGNRLHAVLPPIAPRGTSLAVRVLPTRRFGLDEFCPTDAVPADAAALLARIVSARLAVLCSGGTGTGKTTLLATLLELSSAAERIVLVEDAGELRIDHPHVVRLEGRTANVEGAGGVGLRDLVRQALRMRPDRLVVGEVRGAEVLDLLVALNTGHEGGMATVHANAAAEVPARLEALGALAGLDRLAVQSQFAAGVHAVVHLARTAAGRRVLREVAVVRRDPDGQVAMLPALSPGAPGRPVLQRLIEERDA